MRELVVVVIVMTMCGVVSSLPNFVHMNETDQIGMSYGEFPFSCAGNVTWTVSNFANVFQVDQISSRSKIKVSLKNNFTRSNFTTTKVNCTNKAEQITIHVSCSKPSSMIELTVISFAMKDTSAPYFCDSSSCNKIDSPYNLTVPENTSTGTIVAPWSVCDDDILYGTIGPQYSETISPTDAVIEYSTDSLKLKKSLDYETNTNFNVNMTIKTTSLGSKNSTMEVIIQVKDVDDLGLAFGKNIYECTIPENSMAVPDCIVEAKDLDTQVNEPINYELVSESPVANGVFVVNKVNGSVTVTQSLDREHISVYVLYIKGYQVDRPHEKVNYTTVIVNVTDEDDHAPKMTDTNISVDITENIPVGSIVCQVTAVDKFDQGENAKFTYSLIQPSTLFEVNTLTGLVTTQTIIDRETLDNSPVALEIKAISVVNGTLASDTADIHITVLDENDNSPVFHTVDKGNTEDINITKTQTADVCIFTVNATDDDAGDNGIVRYSIEQDSKVSPLNVFTINSRSGCISLDKSLSESFEFLYRLVIKVEDQAKEFKRSSTMIVRVHVQDVNMNYPVFVNLSSPINISEATPPNTMILELKAEDNDPTDNLTFILQTHQDVFTIDQSILMTKVSLDREKVSSYSINLTVTDSKHDVNETVLIIVEDVNDNAPLFENKTYVFDVNETTVVHPGPQPIGFVRANDTDSGVNGKVTYSIENSQWNGNVSIDATTGNLSVKKLDRDMMGNDNVIQLAVLAVDAGTPQKTGVTMVSINVVGVNDNQPIYPDNNKHVTLYVKEGVTSSSLYKSQAYDADIGVGSEIRYTLANNTNNSFSINPETGVLSINKSLHITSINKGEMYLQVLAQNKDGGKSDKQNITVYIQDINDHNPQFVQDKYNKTIQECVARDKPILSVHATDDDFTKEFNTVFYWIEESLNDTFYIDSNSGSIYVIGNIDYDNPHSPRNFSFQVFATDVGPSKVKNDSTTVLLDITNCNDNLPVFTKGLYQCSIEENKLGSFGCQVIATDLDSDASQAANLSYSIISSESTNLQIKNIDGGITVQSPYDYEAMANHNIHLNISVSDGKFTSYAEVIVEVLNVNDVAPVIVTEPSGYEVFENNTFPYFIGWINITDADSAFEVSFLTCKDKFYIDVDGNVFANSSLDYEVSKYYICQLIATDTVNQATANMTIQIKNVNDNYPVFDQTLYNISLLENRPDIINVNATDGDLDEATYSIDPASVWNGNVSIDATTGNLSVKKLDRDIMGNDNVIQLAVLAVDAGTPQKTGVTMVSINVVGVNDNQPIYPDNNKHVTLYVKEGVTSSSLYKSQAYDADIGVGSEIRYTLANNTNNSFSINPETGVLSINKSLHITSINKGEMYLQVLAQNKDGGKSDKQNITVYIQDINDHNPQFVQDKYNTTIQECVDRDKPILSVHATDDDFTKEFNTVFYWIEESLNDTFYIDSNSGSIYVIGNIDYDNPHNSRNFRFQVFATDVGPLKAKNDSTTVLVDITNCNDNPPVFTKGLYQCSIEENTLGSFGCQVIATDLDSDASQAANLSYSIISSESINLQINNIDGCITVQSPYDYEAMANHTIHRNISVSDGKFTSYAEVIVEVLNVNDVAPVIVTEPSGYEVFENITFPYFIGWINITDSDSAFEVSFLTCKDKFYIDVDGNVFANSALDYEVSKNYICQLIATDTVNQTTANITIQIKNVNDNYPAFDQTLYNISLLENQQDIINVNATDGDLDEVTYSIDPASVWIRNVSVDASTGAITIKPLDRDVMDNNAVIQFIVLAIDNGQPQRTGSAMVKITVLGVNDNPPLYPSYLRHISSTIREGHVRRNVYTSKADDADIGVGSKIHYAINDDPTGAFSISSSSGVISSQALDIHSTKSSRIVVIIEAFNVNGTQNNTQSLTIYIKAVNNYSPKFNDTHYQKEVNECSEMNAEVLRVHATDADSTKQYNTVYYWMEEANNNFYVDMFTGAIHLIGGIDYDRSDKDIHLTIYATDNITAMDKTKDAHANVTLTITDCNDNPPIFTQSLYKCNIDEGKTGLFGCRVEATDIDETSTMKYSIVNQSKTFSIDNLTGNISVNSKFDSESIEANPIFLNVSASDGNFTSYTEVVVFKNNVNDESPVFDNKPYVFNVTENNHLIPQYIGFINVTDADSKIITISILNCSDRFYMTNSGDLFSHTSLDHETETKYVCSIEASDGKNNVHGDVTINILDANDNCPIFNDTYNISINETFPTNKRFLTVTASDDDETAETNVVVYSIFAGNVQTLFSINQNNGDMALAKSLDQFGGQVLELTIKATDNGYPPLTNYTTVTVNVEATNTHPPKFARHSYHALIYENEANQSVFQVSADDMDGTENLKFEVTDNTDFHFGANGSLFATNLDAEKYKSSNGVCFIQMTVSDGIHSDNATANITIIDKNDNNPSFDQDVYAETIKDTTEVQAWVLNVSAFDKDITNDGFTYILRNSKSDFDINTTTGQVYLQRGLGQNRKEYKMVVEVIDSGTPPKKNETDIIITVEDTNTAPTFDDSVTNQTVNENDKTLSISIAAADTDPGQAGNVSYSISAPDSYLNMFTFNSTTAILSLSNSSYPLDYETQPIYHFSVTAEDHGVFPKTTRANITINVRDINEPPYIVGGSDSDVYVGLNIAMNTTILNVSAVDPDIDNARYNKLTYTLLGNGANSMFGVFSDGTIFTMTENNTSGNYSISLTVTDNGNLTVTKPFTIIVPRIETLNIDVNVRENVVHMDLKRLNKTVGGYETFYEIQPSADYGMFAMTTNNVLSLINAFDRETTESTLLSIYGKSIDHDILLANITVNVTIDDENDCAPEFESNKYTLIIDDVMKTGSSIGDVHAIDDDANLLNRNISYSLLNDTYVSGYFRIGKTGEIFLRDVSSMQPQNITLTAVAYDGKYRRNTTVLIRVLDTNNHSPQFNVSAYEFEMVECNCTDTPCKVGVVLATDSDLGNNGNISFSIIAGSHSLFVMDTQGNGSGVLEAVANIDREKNDQFTLTVCAFDMGHQPRQSCVSVAINVLDVNDNPPLFHEADGYVARVVENSASGSIIEVAPSIVALDIDNGENGTAGLTYSLNVTNGPICMSNDYPVSVYICGTTDRETQDVYYLSVEVHDIGNMSASLPLTVYIRDDNDESPEFTESLYTFNVTENANASQYVGKVSVTDQDINGTADITYTVQNNDASPIYIDGITGALYVGGQIDREKDIQYVLNISAFDGRNFNYTRVDIFVDDVNDNAPDFGLPEREIISINVTENIEYGVILNLTAADKDKEGSVNSEVVLRLIGDNIAAPSSKHNTDCDDSSGATIDDSCLFTITQTGQLNLTRYLDREEQDHYTLTIIASDKGETPLSSSVSIYINVLDQNDNDPVFIVDGIENTTCSESHTIEKVPEHSVLKLIDAKDIDFGINGTVSYSIIDSPVSEYFDIGERSGVVSINKPIVVNTLLNIPSVDAGIIDCNETAILNLTISATDGRGRSTNMTLRVFIEPLNEDDAPVFEEMVFNFTIPENEPSDSYVGICLARTVNATYSHMTYSLISGYENTRNDFNMDSKTGAITTRVPLDRENVAQYTFAVKVRDGRIPERTAFAVVEITVSDVNDNSPVFNNKGIIVKIPENSSPHVFNVTASDQDRGQNGSIGYSLVDDYDGLFMIENTTGILNASGPFNFEDVNQYIIEIVASDYGVPHRRNSSVFLNVSITDENDNVPYLIDNITAVNITENSLPQKVFSVIAADKDSGWNGEIIYELINKELTPFVINAFSGDVYLRGRIDYEQKPKYNLTIQAKDQGEPQLFANKTVRVNVIDVYDDFPKFESDTYEVTVSSTLAVVGASLIELDAGVKDVEFSIAGQDASYFKVTSHNLTLSKNLSPDRNLFVVTVTAKDILNQTASCTVIVHTRGHTILFPEKEIPVRVVENLKAGSILVDLNTTEEFLPGQSIVYTIESVVPSESNAFSVESNTGVVRCNKALDRETASQYVITVSARSAETRRKRDVPGASSLLRIIVNVTDVNDNPPKFPDSQQRVFGVPDNVRANYIVTTLKAFDPDVNGAGNIRYNITGGHSSVFGVDQRTGNIITLVAIASVKEKVLGLTVTAYDNEKTGDKAVIDVLIHVVRTENQPYLIVDKSVANFIARKNDLITNMSRILGVDIQTDQIEGHIGSGDDNLIHVDLSKTDFHFHGFYNSSGNLSLVSNSDMERLLQNASTELTDMFGSKPEIHAYHESQDPIYDPSAITSTQILLICMAVFIFFGSGSALFIALYSSSRYDDECQMDEAKKEEQDGFDIELSTLRSRQSSKMSSITAAAAFNPQYQETEIGNQIEQPNESQEMRMNFGEELRFNRDFRVPSGIDSGVGNTSVHSATNHTGVSINIDHSVDQDEVDIDQPVGGLLALDEHGPVMTSSPKPSRPLILGGSSSITGDQEVNQPIPSSSKVVTFNTSSSNIVIFNTSATSETDDDFGGDKEQPDEAAQDSADQDDTGVSLRNADVDTRREVDVGPNFSDAEAEVDTGNEETTVLDDPTDEDETVVESTSF